MSGPIKKKIEDFSECANIPSELREKLNQKYYLRAFKLQGTKTSRLDGTERLHFVTKDNLSVYTVYLPSKDRNSICLSTQIGCPVSCEFCFSGKVKFKRNLSRGEILEQILWVEKNNGVKINSVLFMGMGEPLLNYDNVLSVLRALIDFKEFGIGRRHITLSTVGIVPLIRKISGENLGIPPCDIASRAERYYKKQVYLYKRTLFGQRDYGGGALFC